VRRVTWQRVRVTLVRETATTPYEAKRKIKCATDVADLFRAFVADDPREMFVAVYLDVRHVVVGVHQVSLGTAGSTPVHPREVFQPAIALGASAVIVAHNHPSGDPTPSPDDQRVTERLRQAGELLGVELLDHVILCGAGTGWYSFADEK
jgi:DNA repair protein RadC